MIPFNQDIKTIEEVKKEFEFLGDISSFMKDKKVKKFYNEELKTAKTVEEAKAKALYHFVWSLTHVFDQMVKYGWNPDDLRLLIKRMERAGYDPYSITEDTAGAFIESRPSKGFPEKIINGKRFRLYDPYS